MVDDDGGRSGMASPRDLRGAGTNPRGLAADAVTEMLEIAAGSELRSVVLDIEEHNLASVRVAERLGAERRGTRKQVDRGGVTRTMVVCVLPVSSAVESPRADG